MLQFPRENMPTTSVGMAPNTLNLSVMRSRFWILEDARGEMKTEKTWVSGSRQCGQAGSQDGGKSKIQNALCIREIPHSSHFTADCQGRG
jgi:hypothetical protein